MGLSPASFEYLRGLLRDRAAIVLDADKEYLALARLGELARRHGLPSVDDLIASLRGGSGELHQRVVEAMTTNETSFFRDGHPFTALRTTILPELIRRRADRRALTIWSAACSSGQEPYSVALLIRESFPSLLGWDLRILGTDLSGEMIDRASQAAYSGMEVARGLPPGLLARYFQAKGNVWVLNDEVRRMVELRQVNLAGPWSGLPEVDLLLLRNVLIYLDQSMRKAILGRARAALRPDGYLFLGGAETTLTLDEAFEVVQVEQTTCYRLAVRAARATGAPTR